MKLIKLQNDHFIIVDDSEIKEGDYYIRLDNNLMFSTLKGSNPHIVEKYCKKITHSTEPLDKSLFFTDRVWGCERLSLGEVKELIGEVDVKKKAMEIVINNNPFGSENFSVSTFNGLVKDITKALEDNKDKRFSEEDMLIIRNKLVDILPVGDVSAWDMIQSISKYTKWFDEYVESLTQPKDTWECELVNGQLKLK